MSQVLQQFVVTASKTPQWTWYVSSVAIPFIAAVGAWIAYRQFKIAARQSEISLRQSEIALQQAETSKNKLKLDLFEKRMAVYETVRSAIGKAAQSGRLDQEDQLKYLLGTRSARWLFGQDVFEYLDKTLWHKIVDLELHNTMSEGPRDDPERVKHIHAKSRYFEVAG